MVSKNILSECAGPWVFVSNNISTLECNICLDGKKMKSLDSFYEEIFEKFHCPDYAGKNLNALNELLSDLSWFEKYKYIVLIINSDYILIDETKDAIEGFIETLSVVGEEWSKPVAIGSLWDRQCIPFHSIFQFSQKFVPRQFSQLPILE